MLIRSRPTVIPFFDAVRAYHTSHADDSLSEQDCIRDVIKSASNASHPMHRPGAAPGAHDPPATPEGDEGKMHHHKQVLMIPQFKANAFPEEIKCHEYDEKSWKSGYFVVHFAG